MYIYITFFMTSLTFLNVTFRVLVTLLHSDIFIFWNVLVDQSLVVIIGDKIYYFCKPVVVFIVIPEKIVLESDINSLYRTIFFSVNIDIKNV